MIAPIAPLDVLESSSPVVQYLVGAVVGFAFVGLLLGLVWLAFEVLEYRATGAAIRAHNARVLANQGNPTYGHETGGGL